MIDVKLLGSEAMPCYLQTPYLRYEQKIAELVKPGQLVLELGAGDGSHTCILLQSGAQIIATDISPISLSFIKHRYQNIYDNLKTEVADMENLPFKASSFDVVVCAGSLSYGDPHIVDAEIRLVLRPGGMLICVDSLNHNPVYRINRWFHYFRGNRSRSTLKRMPDLLRIKAICEGFSNVTVNYYGALSFAMPFISLFCDQNTAKKTSDWIDQIFGVKRLAFKFVLVAQELHK